MSIDRMNPEVKPLWLKALRSGEYEQGEGGLNRGGRLCCLGVLCEVAVKAGLEVRVETSSLPREEKTYNGACAYLPDAVAEWAGVDGIGLIPAHIERPRGFGKTNSLPILNDSGDFTFTQIADIIEEHL